MPNKEVIIVDNYPMNPGSRSEWEGSDESYEIGLMAHRNHVTGVADVRSLRVLETPGHRIVRIEELDLARYTGAEL